MIKLEDNIVEEIMTLLANMQCGVQIKNMTAGLLYAYLIMQIKEQAGTGENDADGQHSDTPG